MEQNTFFTSREREEQRTIKVLIVDDQQLFLEALEMMLGKVSFIRIIGRALSGGEALELIKEEEPDVVMTDIEMPGMDGVELTRQLQEHYPRVRVIALTAFENEDYVADMLAAGAMGYLLKTARKERLAEAVKAVMDDMCYYCKDSSEKLKKRIRECEAKLRVKKEAREGAVQFTKLELQIGALVCEELTTPEIAERLSIGKKTVEKYRNVMFAKAGVRNMVGLALYMVRYGLVREAGRM
jgi:DNA-binding NarL/FixJ family response regulator